MIPDFWRQIGDKLEPCDRIATESRQGHYGLFLHSFCPTMVPHDVYRSKFSCTTMQNPKNSSWTSEQAVHFVSNLSPNSVCIQSRLETDFYTPSKSRSERPRDLKLHRVTSNINTNRFQVVWELSGQFLEKVHFCSFCSFRGPGTIFGVLHGCTTKFGLIYIMWNHYLAK